MNRKIVIPAEGEQIQLNGVKAPQEVAHYMALAIRHLAETDPLTRGMAWALLQDYGRPELCLQPLMQMAYDLVYFFPDDIHTQTIKTPRRTLADGQGNCVDYTMLIGSIACAMGLPVIVRAVQLPGQPDLGHVYPVVNRQALDVVPGQNQTGAEIETRQPGQIMRVGVELNFLRKFDVPVQRKSMY